MNPKHTHTTRVFSIGAEEAAERAYAAKKINRSHTHTHTPTENNTPDTHTHTRQEQHPKPPNEHSTNT